MTQPAATSAAAAQDSTVRVAAAVMVCRASASRAFHEEVRLRGSSRTAAPISSPTSSP